MEHYLNKVRLIPICAYLGVIADKKEFTIFEGFMDFLSALTYYKINKFKSDIIILNSVANKSKVAQILLSNEYKKIYLFLDNDKAGIDTKKELYNINHNCIDCSNIYKPHKDFNDFFLVMSICLVIFILKRQMDMQE